MFFLFICSFGSASEEEGNSWIFCTTLLVEKHFQIHSLFHSERSCRTKGKLSYPGHVYAGHDSLVSSRQFCVGAMESNWLERFNSNPIAGRLLATGPGFNSIQLNFNLTNEVRSNLGKQSEWIVVEKSRGCMERKKTRLYSIPNKSMNKVSERLGMKMAKSRQTADSKRKRGILFDWNRFCIASYDRKLMF